MIPDVTPNGVFYLPPTGWLTSFYNPPILKSNKVIWKFNKVRITRWTKIRWDYLIDYGIGNNETYVFLKTKGDDNHCFCISAFRKTDDYTKMQVRMTVLKVVLTNDKGDGKTIYQRKG